MFQRILVPLDGSERAERAIPVALNITRATGGSIVLLRVTPRPTDLYLLPVEIAERAREVLKVRQEEIKQQYLGQLISSKAFEGVETTVEVVDGEPAETILSVAHFQEADLILMCSHGYTGFKRWMLGSVAQKVAWHSTKPVLILRENSETLGGLSPNVGHPIRALVAIDGTPFTETALMPAAQLVAACSAPDRGVLHLAHVIKPASSEEEIVYEQLGIGADHRQAGLHQACNYLQETKERLSHEMGTESGVEAGLVSALDITWSVEESTDVAEALLRMAKGEGEGIHIPSDLIALTTHEHSGLNHWMRGSVAERVLSSTTMPLLIVHPQKHSHSSSSTANESLQDTFLWL